MERLYFDPAQPGSLAGKQTFIKHLPRPPYRLSKKRKLELTREEFPSWDAYTLHHPIRSRHFQRNKTVVYTIDDQWQADLCDTAKLAWHNKNNHFLLTIVDVFSRQAFVKAVKDKSGPVIAKALREVFEETGRSPRILQTDKGTEFWNKHVREVLDKYNVHHFFTYSPDIKASIVERYNRSLKTRLYRYMTHNNTKSYIPVLPDIVQSYNKTYHSSINRAPAAVNEKNAAQVFRYQYATEMKDMLSARRQRPVFAVGDLVRISKSKGTFKKGYLPNWSEDIFSIHEIVYRTPLVYRLCNSDQEIIKGVYYTAELQLVKRREEKRSSV